MIQIEKFFVSSEEAEATRRLKSSKLEGSKALICTI